MGASRKRVEDNRFIRGKGNYVDDIVLPGMLHMEILRSPLAHARIRSIDTSKAWDIPGVRLVLTGEMMATRNLAWMPTLSYDTQAVLATDKVRFQGQEVACVIADDPYIAKDACEAIVVDYEPLPAIVNPMQAMAEGAPLIRDDKENQHDNVVYDWEVGDRDGTDRAFAQADLVSKLELHYPRSHPSPIECCGSIADFNRATPKLTVYMTTQAPHIIRAAVALVAELPEHMIRIISPDLGGGFGNKVPVYPGYVMSILASILLERPVKWIEDKHRQPDLHRLRPRRLPQGRAGAAQGRQDPRRPDAHRRRPRRVLLRRPAEQVQDRADALGVRLLRRPRRAPHRARHVHQQGAGRRRLPLLVPGHRGDVLPGAHGAGGGRRPRHGPGRVPAHQLRPRRRLPAPHAVRLPHRLRPVRQVPRRRAGGDRLPGLPRAEGGGQEARPPARHRHLDHDRAARAPATAASTTSSASRCSTPPSCGCT